MRRQVYIKRDPKTGTYKYRREYPKDISNLLGKTNFIRSLHTKELSEANAKCSDAAQEFQGIVDNIRTRNHVPLAERQELLAYLTEHNILPDRIDDLDLATIRHLIAQLHGTGKPSMSLAIRKLLKMERKFLQLPAMPDDFDIAKMLYQTKPWEKAKHSDNIVETIMARVEQIYTPPPTAVACKFKLRDVYERWEKEIAPSKRQKLHVQTVYAYLEDWCGNRPVNTYTKQELRELLDALKKLPLKLPSNIAILRLRKQVSAVKDNNITGATRTGRTIKSYHNAISALFNFAINMLDVEMKNPVQGISIDTSIGKKKRVPYDAQDLNRIFHSPLYTGFKSRQKRHLQGDMIVRDAKFWLPLIGLFTGAREEEIAQLHIADVSEEKGVLYFHINDYGENKSVKNENSIRIVPVHNELLKIGFKQYFDRLKDNGEQRLFPDLKLSPDARYAKEFSKWYGRYCRKIGIVVQTERTRKDFHSYRHTLITATRRAGIAIEDRMQIVGHGKSTKEARDISDTHEDYGVYEAPLLNKAMQKIKYEELDLSHLYVTASDDRLLTPHQSRVFKLPKKIKKK